MIAHATRATNLRCEYLTDPLGIDERNPRLSWNVESDRRGARQTAYRIRVAGSPEVLGKGDGDRWDSGRIESARTTHVEYQGAPLRSRDRCHWIVEVWDDAGGCARSEPALWSMGLLQRGDWMARWIAADPDITARDPEAVASTLTDCGTPALFRKQFGLAGGIRRATAYATARGLFELRLNGTRVGEDLFAPEWTDYDKRIHYRTYDVTQLVRSEENVIAAVVGDGWWSGYVGWQETRGRYGSLENSLCVQLEIELEDGSCAVVCTDRTWECSTGPILSSDLLMGEVYDARRQAPGWDSPASAEFGGAFDGPAAWLATREVAPPAAVLVAQPSPPVRIVETLKPVSVRQHRKGVFIFDLGQNIAGFVRLRLTGIPAGTRITLRHGERLNPDGSLYTENLRDARATDVYFARGPGADPGGEPAEETWQPHFTFHGFQYVELTGLESVEQVALLGCAIQSATPPAGRFECSHPGVNRLWLNGFWSQRDNFISVPTDCPQRDERLGWMGDAQVFLRTATYNMDVAAFFTKWMVDVEDSQTSQGVFSDVSPRVPEHIRFVGLDALCGAAGWADAGVIVPWTIWRVYGDLRIVERHWSAIVRWLDYLERTNPRGIRENELGNNYGDWLCIPTDTTFRTHSPMKTLLATAYWADDAAKASRMASALGRVADARRFQEMFERVRAAFQREFLLEDGRVKVETQTAYLLALAFDLLPAGARGRATDRLVDEIRSLDWHLSTGFIGISHLNPVLTQEGHSEAAYRLLLQETFPSWLYPIRHGATTIWERWNGWTVEDGFFDPHMNSFNHYSLGSVGEWLFRHVAGIELDSEVPGFGRFVLRPFLDPSLSYARASHRTMHGVVTSHWRLDGANLRWEIRIPANTTARVWIPSDPVHPVQTDGARVIERRGRFLVADAESGAYVFASTWSPGAAPSEGEPSGRGRMEPRREPGRRSSEAGTP